MKKIAIAAALTLLLLDCSAGCPAPAQPSSVEQEDCDAEDYANHEADCGFTQLDRQTKKPAPVPTKRR